MKYFIGADLGTSSLKLMLIDAEGSIVSSTTKDYELYSINSGWSEQYPEDWWKAFCDGIKILTKDINTDEIKGIGVAGQMHSLVALDKNDEVIRPAILWNDGRTDCENDYLNNVIGKTKLLSLTSNISFAGFTVPKLLWLKKHEPDNFNKISKIMLPKDYINYRLTGVHSTDYSDAAGTLLLDVKNKCWSKEMLEICGIKPEQLPSLYESYQKVGSILPGAAHELGLNQETIVAAGGADNAAAAVGTGTIGKDACNISLGTSGTIFVSSDSLASADNGAIHAFCHADGGYHLMGCILSAASCNEWFCQKILNTNDYVSEQEYITDAELGNNHVFFLPYLMGERSPINDTDARGLFIGMSYNSTRKQMVQAVLEGVAFAIRDNLDIIKGMGIDITKSTLCGGGAKSELWQKILCNVLNINIEIPSKEEGPGFGAAILAMVGCGEYKDVKQCCKKLIKMKNVLTPSKELSLRYEEQYQKYKEIYPSVKNLYKKLKKRGI